MRFNDRELLELANKTPVMEGTMQYMKPQSSDWYEWYQTSPFKERIFKLVYNLLFYYYVTEPLEPLGAIVLENIEVAYENPGPAAFTFSLSGYDGKHIFSCRCEEDLNRWVAALKTASYTYWRGRKTVLEAKLKMLKGIEEVSTSGSKSSADVKKTLLKSTFYNNATELSDSNGLNGDSSFNSVNNVPVDNLIQL